MSEPCRLQDDPLDIAIIGGGIAGLSLALGLLTRNVNFRIYERARSFREIGAGIGFSPNAERAMKIIDPRIHAAFKKVATPNMSDWFYWVDGHSEKGDDARLTEDEYIFKLYLGERGFEGCHRADFLDELVKSIPADRIGFQKRLSQIVDRGDGEKLLLEFHDGTEAQADLGTVYTYCELVE
jgi:salicylate hydroxylase